MSCSIYRVVNLTLYDGVCSITNLCRHGILHNVIHVKKRANTACMTTGINAWWDEVLIGQSVVSCESYSCYDSGGLVSMETSAGRHIVGTIVGAVDSNSVLVTPTDVLLDDYTFI